ncbi:hypothetical protein ACFC26_17125 [Kitasatospora purpeofusca]|uniref:hypothetical protein n=1 Tax=Kitasatospora purpeofusca TaxID=67352 RepID=UPI0035D64A4E
MAASSTTPSGKHRKSGSGITKESRTPDEDERVRRYSPWAGGRRHPRVLAAVKETT